jgi:hypothetical protein
MLLKIDPDVKAVAEFMQSTLAAARLAPVASGLNALAPLLWGRYAPESIEVLSLAHPTPASGETSQLTATP